MSMINRILNSNIIFSIIFVFCLTLLYMMSYKFGMIQIGGFDHSAMIDTIWRLQHYENYKDFFNPFPPGFYLPLDWAFKYLSISWESIVKINSIFGVITTIVIFIMLYIINNSKYESLALTLIFQSISVLYISYYWYSSLTAIVLVIYGLSVVYLIKEYRFHKIIFISGISLLSLVKPNMAAFALLTTSSLLLFHYKNKFTVIYSILASIILVSMFLLLNNINPFDVLHTYLSLTGRGLPNPLQLIRDQRIEDVQIYLLQLSIVLLPVLYLLKKNIFKNNLVGKISILFIVTGFYGMMTNFEAKQVEFPIIILGVYFLIKDNGFAFLKNYIIFIFIIFISFGVVFGYKRDRVRMIGGFDPNTVKVVDPKSFFHNVKVGETFNNTEKEIKIFLSNNKNKKIFFGPRLELNYTVFNLIPSKNTAIWWHPGTAFPKSKEAEYFNNILVADFDYLIFLKNDFTYYSDDEVNTLKTNFYEINRFKYLTIFKRKND